MAKRLLSKNPKKERTPSSSDSDEEHPETSISKDELLNPSASLFESPTRQYLPRKSSTTIEELFSDFERVSVYGGRHFDVSDLSLDQRRELKKQLEDEVSDEKTDVNQSEGETEHQDLLKTMPFLSQVQKEQIPKVLLIIQNETLPVEKKLQKLEEYLRMRELRQCEEYLRNELIPKANNKMTDYAAPVVEFEEYGNANTYRLNLEELTKIMGNKNIVNKKVALISIAGECRMGKSFILNFFVTYLEWLENGGEEKWFDATTSLDKFKWRGGTNRDTSGVYIWSHPYLLKNEDNEEIVVLLMDTQGFFDHQSTVKDCATIFAMSTLLSSLQIFNIRSKINENDLNNLLLFTEYANLACEQNEDGPAPLQRLLFLIRDWNYFYEHGFGYEGGEKYLDQVLEISDTQNPELQNLRRKLKTSFDSIDAFLMPFPGSRIASSLTEKVLGEVEPQFGEQLKTFVPSLFGKGDFPLEAKTINGSEITAGELLELFKSYMLIFNNADLPSPKSILAATIEAVNMAAEKKAVNKYDTLIAKKMTKSLADLAALKKIHLQAERQALDAFTNRPKMGGNEAAQSNLENLKNHIRDKYKELKRVVEDNIAIIQEKKRLEEERRRIEAEQERERQRIAEEQERIKQENEELEKKKAAELEEQNRRAKAVFEDAGVTYKPGDVATIGGKLKKALRLRKQKLGSIFKSIRNSRSVQLCFVVDATGSMQSHIDAVKKSIEDIVSQLTNTDRQVNFRGSAPNAQQMQLSFIAYRDHGDSDNPETLNFTQSVADFKGFVAKIVAEGGGDGPEDVFGGLNAALKLDWSPNFGAKVIFHIADAPCHGTVFHNPDEPMYDSYPDGDPHGLTHTELFRRLKNIGIEYYFGKMTTYTDTMIRKFSDVYGQPIVDFDVKKVENITAAVVKSVSMSICSALATTSKMSRPREEKPYLLNKAEPSWFSVAACKGTFSSFTRPESLVDIFNDVPLVQNNPEKAVVKIAPSPFAKGAERFAFYGRDMTGGRSENIVLKEYMEVEAGPASPDRYFLFDQMQNTAAFLAQAFAEEIRSSKTIDLLPVKTLSVVDSSGKQRYLTAEKRFSPTEKFVRFSNNADYILTEKQAQKEGIPAEIVQLVLAFSHWTYKASGRYLMVVDLEGMVTSTGVLLTDPAIHCLDPLRYGSMNLGKEGMENFFCRHDCNQFCKQLGIEDYSA